MVRVVVKDLPFQDTLRDVVAAISDPTPLSTMAVRTFFYVLTSSKFKRSYQHT